MYKCQLCGHMSAPGFAAIRKVTGTREVTYTVTGSNNRNRRYNNAQPSTKTITGTEIVKEILICRRCNDSTISNAP